MPRMDVSLRDFYEIFNVCGKFHVRLKITTWGFARGVPELWKFYLVDAFLYIFHAS